jgi:hypothetical protein
MPVHREDVVTQSTEPQVETSMEGKWILPRIVELNLPCEEIVQLGRQDRMWGREETSMVGIAGNVRYAPY